MHDAREYDAIVASGEQVTAGLLAIVLQDMGIPARSWHGLAGGGAAPTACMARPACSKSTPARSARGWSRARSR